MLVCAFFCAHCTRDRGCSVHPAFPAPSLGENVYAKLGRSAPREGRLMSAVGAPSLRAKRSNPSQRMDCFVAEPVIGARSRDPLAPRNDGSDSMKAESLNEAIIAFSPPRIFPPSP